MKSIGIKQQDRGERAAAKLLDNQTQGIQNLLERNAGGDHLENALLSGQQGFASLSLADISEDRLKKSAAYRGQGNFHRNELAVFAHELPFESQGAFRF